MPPSARTTNCTYDVPQYRQVHAQRMAFMGHTNRFPHVTTSLSLDVLRQCRSYDDGDDAPALLLVVPLLLDPVSELLLDPVSEPLDVVHRQHRQLQQYGAARRDSGGGIQAVRVTPMSAASPCPAQPSPAQRQPLMQCASWKSHTDSTNCTHTHHLHCDRLLGEGAPLALLQYCPPGGQAHHMA